MTLQARITAPTPCFFKKIRKWGLIVAGIGGAIIAAPITLPTILVTIGGYLAVAGAATVAVSQAAVKDEGGKD